MGDGQCIRKLIFLEDTWILSNTLSNSNICNQQMELKSSWLFQIPQWMEKILENADARRIIISSPKRYPKGSQALSAWYSVEQK